MRDLQQSFTVIKSRLTAMEGRLSALESRFSAMEQRFAVHEERMTAMLGPTVGVAERVERAEPIFGSGLVSAARTA